MLQIHPKLTLTQTHAKSDLRIKNYFWKEFMDFYVPCLYMESRYHHFSCILHGTLYFNLGEQFCVKCGAHIAPHAFLSLCNECYHTEDTAHHLCILKGAGAPYARFCNLENPPCHDLYRRDSFCKTEHIVYIGRFGSLFKIGVTRNSRKEYSGIHSRLLDQGLDEVLIISQKFTLPDAQRLEAKISLLLNIPKWISFPEKVEDIIKNANMKDSLDKDAISAKMNSIRTMLTKFVPKETVSHAIVDRAYMVGHINSDCLEWISRPERLEGEVVVAKGNVLITRLDSNYLVYDLTKLQGREILLGG